MGQKQSCDQIKLTPSKLTYFQEKKKKKVHFSKGRQQYSAALQCNIPNVQHSINSACYEKEENMINL